MCVRVHIHNIRIELDRKGGQLLLRALHGLFEGVWIEDKVFQIGK